MKNTFILKFKSKLKLKIKGKNIERFLRRLVKNKIELISVKYRKYNEVEIIIYKEELEKIEKLKTIYEVEIINKYGINKILDLLNINKYLIIFIIFGIFLLYLLSNMIFDIEVIHTDPNIRKIIKEELENYNIKEHRFRKSYSELQKIKENILNKYKDKLEWIEIERDGTKYIVRVEERIITQEKEKTKNRDIVAKKNGIIIDIDASSGEIVKNVNDYVKKGDVIISGNLYLNETYKESVSAEGTVYAETWYTVNVSYPFNYKETKLTNDNKTVFTIKFLDKYYDLFNLKKYKTKKIENKILFKNNLLPFSFIKQKQIKTIEINETYNEEEAINKGVEEAKIKLLKKIDKDSEILKYRIMDKKIEKDKVNLKVFLTVKENITSYKEITEIPKEE